MYIFFIFIIFLWSEHTVTHTLKHSHTHTHIKTAFFLTTHLKWVFGRRSAGRCDTTGETLRRR